MTRILGLDLSLNHLGAVLLDELGNVAAIEFVTDTQAAAKAMQGGVLLPKSKSDDGEQFDLERLAWWERYLADLLRRMRPTHVAIENYAFASTSKGQHAIAEVGGLARLAVARAGAALRLTGPESVKLFATGKGNATGGEVAAAVRAELGALFVHPKKALVEEDLAAGYTLARMAWLEVELRAGRRALASLPEHQVRTFNRCTKATPMNLLARDWLRLPTEAR